MELQNLSLFGLLGRTVVVHTVSYFVVGWAAFVAFDYSAAFAEPGLAGFMRDTDHPLVRLGVLFQPVRGVLFGLAFFPLRSVLFGQRQGWAVTWLMLVMIGIFSTFGPSPGSVEGLIYTQGSPGRHLLGLVEVLLQSLLLSTLLFAWVTQPQRRWLGRTLVGLFVVAVLLPLLGALAG